MLLGSVPSCSRKHTLRGSRCCKSLDDHLEEYHTLDRKLSDRPCHCKVVLVGASSSSSCMSVLSSSTRQHTSRGKHLRTLQVCLSWKFRRQVRIFAGNRKPAGAGKTSPHMEGPGWRSLCTSLPACAHQTAGFGTRG